MRTRVCEADVLRPSTVCLLVLLTRPPHAAEAGLLPSAGRTGDTAGPILSVFFALIMHSELKKVCTPDFQWHLFFKHKLGLINK